MPELRALSVSRLPVWKVRGLGANIEEAQNPDIESIDRNEIENQSVFEKLVSNAQLQGIHKSLYGTVMDHNELRSLLQDYSTPQAPSSRKATLS